MVAVWIVPTHGTEVPVQRPGCTFARIRVAIAHGVSGSA